MAAAEFPFLTTARQVAVDPDYITQLTPYEQFLAHQYYADKVKAIFTINFTYSVSLNAVALWRYRKRPSYFHLGVVALCLFLVTGDLSVFAVLGFHRWAEHVRYLTTVWIGTLISILSLTRFQLFGADWLTKRVYRSMVGINILLMLVSTCMLAAIVYVWTTIPNGGEIIEIGAIVSGVHLGVTLLIDLVLSLFTLKLVLQLRMDLSQAQKQSIRSSVTKISYRGSAGDDIAMGDHNSVSSDNLSVYTLYRGARKISPMFALRMRQILIAIAGMIIFSFATVGAILVNEGTFTDMLGECAGRNYILFCMIEWTLIVDLITEGRQLKATATAIGSPSSPGIETRWSRLSRNNGRATSGLHSSSSTALPPGGTSLGGGSSALSFNRSRSGERLPLPQTTMSKADSNSRANSANMLAPSPAGPRLSLQTPSFKSNERMAPTGPAE